MAGSLAEAIRQQFRKVARAVTAITMSPAQRRKRKEETKGSFKLARAIGRRVRRSIFDPSNFNHVPAQFDEAGYFLRRLLDEWAQEDDHQHQPESFHYGSAADFDPRL
jgi:hypothetical protein